MKEAGGERYFHLCNRQICKTGNSKPSVRSQGGGLPVGRVGKGQSGCWALLLDLMLAS